MSFFSCQLPSCQTFTCTFWNTSLWKSSIRLLSFPCHWLLYMTNLCKPSLTCCVWSLAMAWRCGHFSWRGWGGAGRVAAPSIRSCRWGAQLWNRRGLFPAEKISFKCPPPPASILSRVCSPFLHQMGPSVLVSRAVWGFACVCRLGFEWSGPPEINGRVPFVRVLSVVLSCWLMHLVLHGSTLSVVLQQGLGQV